jgi:hypothetical protein
MATNMAKYHLQSGISWKEKAKRRRLEINKLKQRIKELEQSRMNWKVKAMESGLQATDVPSAGQAAESEKKLHPSL